MSSKNVYLFLSIFFLVFYSVKGRIYKTQSCEGHTLKLSCYFGGTIKVLSADYGRWNASVCQYFEDPEMNLNCHSMHAKDIIKAKCDGHKTCRIKADNAHFLDPCPGQIKYAVAKYKCVEQKKYGSHLSHTSLKDELINKGFNALLNMAYNYDDKIKYDNNINHVNYANHNEIQPAFNPSYQTQSNKYNLPSRNGTIGWNIF